VNPVPEDHLVGVHYAAFAILFALAAFVTLGFARFAVSFVLAAADNFRFGAAFAVSFFSPWNAAQRFRRAAAILRLAAADMIRFALRVPSTAGAAAYPSTCLRIAAIVVLLMMFPDGLPPLAGGF
jgi:hypothetical protein